MSQLGGRGRWTWRRRRRGERRDALAKQSALGQAALIAQLHAEAVCDAADKAAGGDDPGQVAAMIRETLSWTAPIGPPHARRFARDVIRDLKWRTRTRR